MQTYEYFAEDEEDEIDLVKLVSSSADIANKYLIFEGANAEYYAVSVAKIEELFVYSRDGLLSNNSKDTLIIGTLSIRSIMTPLLYFDAWFGNTLLDEEAYELIILYHFSSEYLGLIVKQVVDIVSIEPEQMQSSAKQNALTTHMAKVTIGKKTLLCTIFDSNKLLYDLYGQPASAQ
jgi:two-component system chemotaxis response regulator CheV